MSAPQVNPLLFGKYQLIERLGRGGMAEVWKAQIIGPMGFARTLVLKRILPHLSEDAAFVQMFVGEALLSARLTHPNIVQVYELGEVNGEYFLAMEYVRGCDLFSLMRAHMARGAPPPGMGAYVVREVCRALAYAHSLTQDDGTPLRLIHRDVSPSNVMLSFEGSVKLVDFGIAKALNAGGERTSTGTLKGKLAYMAPEQAEQSPDIDHRADLFAAGIVLHEALTGRRLFKAETEVKTLQMVREAIVVPPSQLNPDVPPELDAIVLKALSLNRDERYASCDQMAIALDDVVAQLKWGPERLAALAKELVPQPEPTKNASSSLPPVGSQPSSLTVGALRRKERLRYLAYGSVALATVGALAWVVVGRSGQQATATRAVESPAPKPVELPPPPSPPTPQQPENIKLSISSKPRANVRLADEKESRGRTPIDVSLPRRDGVVKLVLTAEGYLPLEREVQTDADFRLELALDRAPAPPSPVRKKKKPNDEEIVDPFGDKPKN